MGAFNKQMSRALALRAVAAERLKAAFSDAKSHANYHAQRLTEGKPFTGLIEKYPYVAGGVALGAGVLGGAAVTRAVRSCLGSEPKSPAPVLEPQRVVIEVKHSGSAAVSTPKQSSSFMDFIKQAVVGYETVQNVLKPLMAQWKAARQTAAAREEAHMEEEEENEDDAIEPAAPVVVPPIDTTIVTVTPDAVVTQ